MTLTKSQLIESVQQRLDLPRKACSDLVESLLEIIKQTLADGEDLLISGFGKFCVKEKQERRGRNPQTGENLMLGSRRVVIFKCSGVMRDKMDRNGTI